MKRMARRYVVWPSINRDVKRAAELQERWTRNIAFGPKERIHLDFAGPIMGKMWFVAVDAQSKFPLFAFQGHSCCTGPHGRT